jgi:hypothetical protein
MKRIMFAFFLIVLVVIAGCTLLLLSQTGNQTTEDPDDSNTAVLADYTVTIPEIYELGFGVAEINMRFIASSPSLQEEQLVSEANFTTTKSLLLSQRSQTTGYYPYGYGRGCWGW